MEDVHRRVWTDRSAVVQRARKNEPSQGYQARSRSRRRLFAFPFVISNECVYNYRFLSANKVLIIKVILELEEMITEKEVSGPVRDTVIDLMLKNLMHMDGGLPRGWSWRFVEDRGTFA